MFASTRENLSNDITSHKESSHPIQFRRYTAVHCSPVWGRIRNKQGNLVFIAGSLGQIKIRSNDL